MKNLFPALIFSLFLAACGGGETENKNVIDEVEGTSSAADAAAEPEAGLTATTNNNTPPSMTIDQVMAEFINCKEHAEESFKCKGYPAKAICALYGINDFQTGPDEFIKYDELMENLDKSKWKRVGDASSQAALDEAQAAANAGRAAFTIEEGEKYGNIAIILPGETSRSSKWGVNCPNSASLFMGSSYSRSYANKGLNYAYSSNENIGVYVRQ